VRVEPLGIDGAWSFTPAIHEDQRESFLEWFRADELARITGHPMRFVQSNCSVSRLGVIRGIHFADIPPGQQPARPGYQPAAPSHWPRTCEFMAPPCARSNACLEDTFRPLVPPDSGPPGRHVLVEPGGDPGQKTQNCWILRLGIVSHDFPCKTEIC
jgi:hypothetical protein